MRSSLSLICLVCSVSTAWSAEIPNGIYRVVDEGFGTLADRSIGGRVVLGKRLSEDFGEVSIWSTSNQNDRFRVWMKGAGLVGNPGQIAVCIEGVCEVIGSQGKSAGSDKADLIADVSGKENARKIAAAFNAKIMERKHPGYLFQIEWKPVKDQFKVGEAVTLELAVKNVGPVPVYFMEGGQNRGPRDNQFGFTAFSGFGFGKAVPDTGDPTNFGGLAGFRTLKPGETFRK